MEYPLRYSLDYPLGYPFSYPLFILRLPLVLPSGLFKVVPSRPTPGLTPGLPKLANPRLPLGLALDYHQVTPPGLTLKPKHLATPQETPSITPGITPRLTPGYPRLHLG